MKPDERLKRSRVLFLVEFTVLFLSLAGTFFSFVPRLPTKSASPGPRFLEEHILTQNPKMRLMGRETQHDEIGVKTIDDVASVGIVLGVRSLGSDKFHDLVFAFSRDRSVGNDDFHLNLISNQRRSEMDGEPVSYLLPSWVGIKLVGNPIA